MEVSAVPVPANRSALRRSDGSGLSPLTALWPVLASQVDELARLAGDISETVAELEYSAKGMQIPDRSPDPAADQVLEIISALRSGRV